MAKVPTPERWQREADILEVRVTVLAGGGRQQTARARGLRPDKRLVVALVGVLMAIAALGIALAVSRHPARRVGTRLGQGTGPAGVAAAYGYPERCLSVTILASHPTYARADFNHELPCGRYSGDTAVVLHRVGGAWHLILDATAYSCPVTAIPPAVQAALGVCDVPAQRSR